MKSVGLVSLLLLALGIASPVSGQVVISEFMASNIRVLADDDGSYEDWIEVRNTTPLPVDLAGWFLTDNSGKPTKWQFPSTNLNAGAQMVVFASGKDRRAPGRALHTNFKLSASGGYLGLYKPDGVTAATAFVGGYPRQVSDVSYGFGLVSTNRVLVDPAAALRVLVPVVDNGGAALGDSWKGGAEPFDDAAWATGSHGAGYSGPEAQLVAQSALVLRYNFDAAPVSNVILDTHPTGTAHNGANKGATWAAVSTDGAPNPVSRSGVMQFLAISNQVFTVTGNPDFNTPQGTIAFWMRTAGIDGPGGGGAAILDRRTVTGGLLVVHLDDGRLMALASGATSTTRASVTTSALVADDRWHQVVITYDQSATGSLEVLIDGVSAGSASNSAAWSFPASQAVTFGRSGDTAIAWRRYNGALDDVRWYNRILTSAEVAQLHAGDGGVAPADYGVDLAGSLRGHGTSAFVRIPFVVDDPAGLDVLYLRVRYDDGYVAWINGRRVGGDQAPDAVAWDSAATGVHSGALSETVVIGVVPGLLRAGTNILALQGLNVDAQDPTFLIGAEMQAAGVLSESDVATYFTRPTPGQPNGVGSRTPGPVIYNAQHSPQVPRQGEPLLVTAQVEASFGVISNVVLRYRVMFTPEVTLPMYDDGQHGDGAAGDGLFGAWIPGDVATNGQMIRYAVTALDFLSNTSRWPLFNDPLNTPEYLGTVVAPDSITSKLPVFHLFVSQQNISKIDDEGGGRLAVFLDGEFYDNVYMELRGNTSASLPKKSHRMEFNREHPLRHPGPGTYVRKTSFIAEHLDPAYLRQGLSFWLLNETGTPAPFYYPVRLQMNGSFYQLASHTDVMGEDQLARMGYNPSGALYKAAGTITTDESSTGGFEKKTRTWESHADYQALAAGISADRPLATRRTNLFEMLDVPNVVNYLACARWVQEGDDVWANMTIYRDSDGDGRWRIIPFDMNLSWGQLYYGDNSDRNAGVVATDDENKSHPLYGGGAVLSISGSAWNRMYDVIISVPETRQMLLRRMRTIMDGWIQPPTTHPLLRKFEARITALTNQMWAEAFIDRAKWGWPALGGPYGLGDNQWITNATQDLVQKFIEPRRVHWYVTHSATNTARPIGVANAKNAGIPDTQPADAAVRFAALDFSPATGNQAQEYLCLTNPNPYAVDLSDWRLSGAVQFAFKGGTVMPSNSVLYVSPDLAAFSRRPSGPRGGQGLFVVGPYQGQLSARGEPLQLEDADGRPVDTLNYPGSPSAAQQALRLTELMYHPAAAPAGSAYQDSDFEYVELQNIGGTPLDLAGIHFTNGIAFEFSRGAVTQLAPGAYVLVVANPAAFASRYGARPNIAGAYTGSLNNGGDRVTLHDAVGEVILDFKFRPDWYPVTDGTGFSLVIRDAGAALSAWDQAEGWQPSRTQTGTPAAGDPAPPRFPRVVVNEVLSNPLAAGPDQVELLNLESLPADVSGWYLSDDLLDPLKYRLPPASVIPAGGYLVVSETAFNAHPGKVGNFALGASGDSIHLFSADAPGVLSGYHHGLSFGAAAPGVSFGRVVTSDGLERVAPMATPTLGTANSDPQVGPVILSEIHYHPAPSSTGPGLQFVELLNLTGSPVPLFDTLAPTNTWHVRGDVDFDFPTNIVLAPGEAVVLVGFDPEADAASESAFRAALDVPQGVRLWGPFRGGLSNGGGDLRLTRPNPPAVTGVDHVVVDEVAYTDSDPWPVDADGFGASMQRRAPAGYSGEPLNWMAALPRPGRVTAAPGAPVITHAPEPAPVLAGQPLSFAVTAQGGGPLGYQWLLEGHPIEDASAATYTVPKSLPANGGLYQVVVATPGGTVRSDPVGQAIALPSFFVFQPQSRSVLAGTNITFYCPVVGNGDVAYQWRKDGAPIAGATTASLQLINAQPSDSGVYDLLATDNFGVLASSPATVVVSIKPAFVFPPQPLTVLEGQTAVLFATVSGTGPLSYRWSKASKTITNYTTPSTVGAMVLPNVQTSQAGSYSLTVSNLGGSVTVKSPAVLTVLSDADRDGMFDGWEAQQGFDSTKPGDADLDADGDGMSNRSEYVAGTDPHDAASHLALQITRPAGTPVVRFNAVAGRSYSLLSSTNLVTGPWVKAADFPVNGSDKLIEYAAPDARPGGVYYRLVVPAQP